MMEKTEAEMLIARLSDGYDRKIGAGRKSMYTQRFEEWDFDIARRAVNNLLDTEDHFPSLSKFLERCQYYAGLKPATHKDEQEVPMTPDELHEAAAQMATEAAARLARHNGVHDVYSRLLEQGATVYARNATLRARGQPSLPLPKIATLIAGLAKQHGIERGLVDDAVTQEDRP